MTVTQLIEILSKCAGRRRVGYLWDGEVRSVVSQVWVSQNGVVLSDGHNHVGDKYFDIETPYSDKNKPIDADHFWIIKSEKDWGEE